MTVRKSALFALCFTSFTTAAQAGPDQISILLGSEHVNGTGFEEFNPGIFLTWRDLLFDGRADLSFGGFRNSYGDGSLAVSMAFPIVREKNWGLELFTALAWYPGNGERFEIAAGDIVPIAGLQARLGPTFVQIIPGGGDSVDATISFGLTFALPK